MAGSPPISMLRVAMGPPRHEDRLLLVGIVGAKVSATGNPPALWSGQRYLRGTKVHSSLDPSRTDMTDDTTVATVARGARWKVRKESTARRSMLVGSNAVGSAGAKWHRNTIWLAGDLLISELSGRNNVRIVLNFIHQVESDNTKVCQSKILWVPNDKNDESSERIREITVAARCAEN